MTAQKHPYCRCGADLGKVKNRVYFDDANAAISKSSRPQCLPCYAEDHMRRVFDWNEVISSGDLWKHLTMDSGRDIRARYLIVKTAEEIRIYA